VNAPSRSVVLLFVSMSEVIAFMGGILATAIVFAFFYPRRQSSQETQIPYLTERRDEALRRVGHLRAYACFCEQEAKCWPEDSLDRAELTTYAAVATRLADESQREWREMERKLRAERFEEITKRG
jgi:hypothetical protein